MEFSLSGNALKTFNRSITCLARIGNELVIEATSSQLVFHTLNSSRSAYQSITLKADFFDVYSVSATQVQCSVLLKAVCSFLRTPISSIDRLSMLLPNADAAKVQWTLDCFNGMKKSYWISCNVEPDIQHLALDKNKFPSNLVVRPCDLNKLLNNFQSSLQEITVIATEPAPTPCDSGGAVGGKAVELRSYIDPTKDNDTSLHTQLWIDPAEEFLQYKHTGDAVDVTFSVKELKAFLTFCEGCEVDIHFFFEKAGEPILMAPIFGLDDTTYSDFDARLVLATMLTSQLREAYSSELPQAAPVTSAVADYGAGNIHVNAAAQARSGVNGVSPGSENPSDHTRIWSELSGSAAKSCSGLEERQAPVPASLGARVPNNLQRLNQMDISADPPVAVRKDAPNSTQLPVEAHNVDEPQDGRNNRFSQHHPSNWINADDDDDDEDEDEGEIYVQSTP